LGTLDRSLDHWIAGFLAPLAIWVLVNGLDDLVIDIAAVVSYIRNWFSRDPNERTPSEAELDAAPPRLMAIFVALWKEHRVIQKMIENNVTRLQYPRFEFFVGGYPNDGPTLAAIREAMKRFPNVHLAVCPHDGPTSKADCLNWIYQRMLLYEEENDVRFDMILTHDAEDLMDPDALRWINYYAQWNEMVQIPVLALKTPFTKITHGVYCDEFAEFQFKDMPARQLLGGFIPSNGVGTGFSRLALEKLAEAHGNRIFEPTCLTEDYENGWRIRNMGMRQKFIPIHFCRGRPIATREFFPRNFNAAVRQRTRWVTGIALQSWEFHDRRDTLRMFYWFWRDRKGLIGNLVTPLTNILFLFGTGTWAGAKATHRDWALAHELSRLYPIYMAGLALQVLHTSIRAACSARVYGVRFACGVPVRVMVGNWINCFSTSLAIWKYTNAKLRGQPLRWAKTDHAYPSRAALVNERKGLGEILTGSLWITPAQLEEALSSRPADVRLGEHLVCLGMLSEQDLYTALSLQNNLPLGKPEEELVSVPVTRALPAAMARKWRVLPFRIAAGELHVAGAELPVDEMHTEIRRFSSLELHFHLITPTEFEQLAVQYLGEATCPA
jgi:adsorption protein B